VPDDLFSHPVVARCSNREAQGVKQAHEQDTQGAGGE
jgi:hypothetical protein